MKRTGKGKVKFLLLLLVCAGLLIVVFCEFFSTTEYRTEGSFQFAENARHVSVCLYTWDGTEEGLTIEIPDEWDGRKVTGLGYSEGNAPFVLDGDAVNPEHMARMEAYLAGELDLPDEETDIVLPGEDFREDDRSDGSYDEIVYTDFTLKIGKNVRKIWAVADDVTIIHEDGIKIAEVNRVYVECDPDNETYYAKEGILYERKEDKVVEGFRYIE